jgi:hypothetical protein
MEEFGYDDWSPLQALLITALTATEVGVKVPFLPLLHGRIALPNS